MPPRRKSNKTQPETPEQTVNETPEKSYILATGLEDYGRWKSMYQNHQRDPKEKPFRRGRIWC